MAQRPELFGAALPGVGVMDMLRYHTASANAYAWSTDYGTVGGSGPVPRACARTRRVHNLKPGRCYPPTLVTTADHDDRVVPWHSFKFAAALQHAQACASPVLIRIETRAGHGAGKPTWMLVEDWANQWAFLAKALGMQAGAARGNSVRRGRVLPKKRKVTFVSGGLVHRKRRLPSLFWKDPPPPQQIATGGSRR